MKKSIGSRLGTLLTALAGVCFLVSFSVVLVLNLRQIYYHDAKELRLAEQAGLTEEQLRENYDVLIDYNLIWTGVDELEFPDFPMSEHGRIHFEEVRRIFIGLQVLMIVSLGLLIFGLWSKIRKEAYECLRMTAVLSLVIPTVLGAAVAWNWEWFFVTFHRIAFSNDYWLFDPSVDPIIEVLPDIFFLHCAGAVLLCLVAGSAAAWVAYRILIGRAKRS